MAGSNAHPRFQGAALCENIAPTAEMIGESFGLSFRLV